METAQAASARKQRGPQRPPRDTSRGAGRQRPPQSSALTTAITVWRTLRAGSHGRQSRGPAHLPARYGLDRRAAGRAPGSTGDANRPCARAGRPEVTGRAVAEPQFSQKPLPVEGPGACCPPLTTLPAAPSGPGLLSVEATNSPPQHLCPHQALSSRPCPLQG